MASLLMPLPQHDFDPSEAGVLWQVLTQARHQFVFATPAGEPATADPRMVNGDGLGVWKGLLRADRRGRDAHSAMIASAEFQHPIAYDAIDLDHYDALTLPGGHAPGMRPYLESELLHERVAEAFARDLPVAAICHGVLLAARATGTDGRSVLYQRHTTALLSRLELAGWLLTCLWLGRYYRTYPMTTQAEVTAALAHPSQFHCGPLPLRRDDGEHLERGFVYRDGHYYSARWPGDAHRLATEFAALLGSLKREPCAGTPP